MAAGGGGGGSSYLVELRCCHAAAAFEAVLPTKRPTERSIWMSAMMPSCRDSSPTAPHSSPLYPQGAHLTAPTLLLHVQDA